MRRRREIAQEAAAAADIEDTRLSWRNLSEEPIMSVSSIGSAPPPPPQQPVQSQPEASEVKKSAPDHDGDADDGGSTVQAQQPAPPPPPAPTVNLDGQQVGQIVNTTA
jgi:hypothetical protein